MSRPSWWLCLVVALMGLTGGVTFAHPLGNFTINHFASLRMSPDAIQVQYVVDYAEIAAFQQVQLLEGEGEITPEGLQAWAQTAAVEWAGGMEVMAGGELIKLRPVGVKVEQPEGTGGLKTLRVEVTMEGAFSAAGEPTLVSVTNTNMTDRQGWRELVVAGGPGTTVFDSNIPGDSLSQALTHYPSEAERGPLHEVEGQFKVVLGGLPSGGNALTSRAGEVVERPRDALADLVVETELNPMALLIALLTAVALGAVHAMSPGHGKTVVGAYLVGSRGTVKHAMFLGLTVTITHTAGVFALGLVTLFASQVVSPERLYPVLTFASGGIVLALGVGLMYRRSRVALGWVGDHHHHSDEDHDHSHGAGGHTHLPPGADGGPVTWRSLLALGISGGLVPCPSALVVLLSAISLGKVGLGLMLILAFSFGLALALTAIGLSFVWAGKLVDFSGRLAPLVRWAPVLGAVVVTVVGVVLCWQAVSQANVTGEVDQVALAMQAGAMVTASVLGLGLVLGMQHALDADHLAAVSTIVSEHKSVWSASLVGGLWGMGHSFSILIAGLVVLFFHVQIGETTSMSLEMAVAFMLIGLGVNTLRKVLMGEEAVHVHTHQHAGETHEHLHVHPLMATHKQVGFRPLVVGMVHGMAGSAALMLLVLATIPSPVVGLLYLLIFGLGSVGGMMIMSALMALPLHLAAGHFLRAGSTIRVAAGLFSLGFGSWMVYEIGFVQGLFL